MRSILPFLLLASAAAPVMAQDKPADSGKPQSSAETLKQEAERAAARPSVEEREAVSRGSVTIRGQKVDYTATAGTLTIRDDAGEPTASVFYTAYTRPGANRPVTFLFNGGPGSATVWLHMGSLGPVRVATGDPVAVAPASYALRPNPDSLLDKSDLVFIDAIGAGWSRPLGDKTGKDFWGVDQDADAFARAITRYVDKNNRWTSPKVVFGESYGTLRAGAVGALLEQRGMSLDGIVFLSSILNYGVRQPGYDQNTLGLFPTFAATAWYHGRVADRPASVEAFVAEARAFASGPYAAALAKGSAISDEEKRAVAAQVARFTGLSQDYVLRADLRVSLSHFQTELLRDRGVSTGRLDTRYLLDAVDANADSPEDDPASTAVTGAYVSAFEDYAARTLKFTTDMPYKLSARDGAFDWDWRHRAPGDRGAQPAPNTAVDLAYTMRMNPHLKVLFLNGYYDAATPFYSTEFDVAHMPLPAAQRRNISFTYYQSGHMIYLNPQTLTEMRTDLGRWYDSATAR